MVSKAGVNYSTYADDALDLFGGWLSTTDAAGYDGVVSVNVTPGAVGV